ncbi:Adaptor protein complex beta subunit [Hesseltinella vesiculosa]|uniref:AP complex subunit beta n=1 Tax=Hesseltinella vesiculosa TaxID=101127 RepID=A0A1X2GJD2_9FUNG|nr:Adaptor protein complex beta subunit [Hesseltinella vesiculosa]
MHRHRFFSTNKRGENFELKADLNSEYRHVRSDAVKKVIANMTVGKDVSGLFPDVLKNMQTENIELKKLVYLYLMNYSKTQPELVILAVNTFVKDSDDPNPLIRALAIRTMGCIRVDKIIDYLTEPLRKCLKDENPYVRKTAATCVAKLYEMNPDLTIEQEFIPMLQEMVSDVNPMVVANAVVALLDINEMMADGKVFKVTHNNVNNLLHALNECTEWGQVVILTALTDYRPLGDKEAEGIIERVMPRLQHANGAVVLAAVKVILALLRYENETDFRNNILRKMAPPLATLLANPPEFQFIALRNIQLVLQKYPAILDREMRVFFCKYNDPLYVKLEKLQILIDLANPLNVDQLLSELKEYANEVDVEFVRQTIHAIGRVAIKIEEGAEACVHILMSLIETGVSYVVQEAMVVIMNIFRKYPNQYEAVIPHLCSNLDAVDEPPAKAALIWMIGEYGHRIDNATELIDLFFETFSDESSQVQLQILTATVKLFLKKPQETQDLVQQVLQVATTGCDNADLRDRGYVYWRLLSTDPEAAKGVILSEKPPIQDDEQQVPPSLLETLLLQIGSLSSVYKKPAETFIAGERYGANRVQQTPSELEEEDVTAPPPKIQAALKNNDIGNLLDLDWDEPASPSIHTPTSAFNSPRVPIAAISQQTASTSGLDDLLGLSAPSNTPPTVTTQPVQSDPMDDFFGISSSDVQPVIPAQPSTSKTNDPFADLL